jgi:hypothetical protein
MCSQHATTDDSNIAFIGRFEEFSLVSWQLKAVLDLLIPMRFLYIFRRTDWKDARKVNIGGRSTGGNLKSGYLDGGHDYAEQMI